VSVRSEEPKPRAFRRVRGTLAALIVVGVVGASAAVVQARAQTTEFQWSDLPAADAELTEIRADLVQATERLNFTRSVLAEARSTRHGVESDELAYASTMQAFRERARLLAVEAYMSGGALSDAAYLLDSLTANEWAYRTGVLTGSAESVAGSSRSYQELRTQASDTAVALAGTIDDAAKEIRLALDDLARLERLVSRAEYVVWIAQIHALADSAHVRFGRTEPTGSQWRDLRFCESTENYAVATGNGFWGAYQFTLDTWETVGGSGRPSETPPEEQDARARLLYHRRGWQPWPVCGRFLPQE
jgi:hypothetical protein